MTGERSGEAGSGARGGLLAAGSAVLLVLGVIAGCGDSDPGLPDACVDCTWDGGPPPDGGPPGQATILRDTYGVPHIFAPGLREAMYAWGWADAEDMREGMLVALWGAEGTSSRRLGATCGQVCVNADAVSVTFEVPDAVAASYGSLSERTRTAIEAYAAGADAWFRQAGGATLYDPATPVTAQAIVGAIVVSRIMHAVSATQVDLDGGSNQLAVTGDRTAGGLTILLKDPHNAWTDGERYVHLSFGDYDIVGNGGFGNLGCGGNNFVSWGCTRSAPATVVSVRARIETAGTDPGEAPCGAYTRLRYFDHREGGFTDFSMRCIDIDTGDSGIDATTWIYVSRFGVMTAVNDIDGDRVPDEAFISHVFAATDVTIVDYAIDRMLARSSDDFRQLWSAPTPREDAQYRAYAAADGEVGIVLGAAVPALDPALSWSQPVSSDDPRIDSWTPNADWSVMDGVVWHNVDGVGPELPHVFGPVGDFVQNCNGGPTDATEPPGQVGPVPSFLEFRTGATVRGRRMHELVASATDLDVAGIHAVAADLVVPIGRDLVTATKCGVDTEGIDPVASWGDGGRLINTLLAWEADGYRAEATSTAMTVLYLIEVSGADVRYPEPGACLSRAQLDGLGAFLRDDIAPYMRRVYARHADPLAVPWGYVNHVIVGGTEVGMPGGGGLNVASLFVSFFQVDPETGRAIPSTHGGSRVPQILAYGSGTFETWISVPHGQVSEVLDPTSPHIGQTIDDFVARRFRQVPLRRSEIEAALCPWGDDPGHEHPTRTDLTL